MQRVVNINGKDYPLENEEFALRCLLNHIKHTYKDLETYKEKNMSYMISYTDGMLQGLKSAYYFITGKDLSDDEIKELADSKSN